MNMNRAVITGGTGMVAAALERVLSREGIETLLLVRPRSRKLSLLRPGPRTRVMECDLSDLHTLGPSDLGRCDAFFHMGWDGTYGDSRSDIRRQMNNIRTTLDAAELAGRLGCGVFVGAGSQAEYGHVDGILAPQMPVSPENGYGIAKYAAGKLSAIRCAQLGIRHCWARIVSLYGRGDNDYTMMMSCIRNFLYGRKMSFTKGEQIWDYLNCEDAGEAFYRIALYGRDQAVYPLGSGKSRRLSDFITDVRDLLNPSMPVSFGELEYPPNQVMHLCADISSLTADTGFVPKISFSNGVMATADWIKKVDGNEKD